MNNINVLAAQMRHSFNPSLLTMFKKRTESTDLLLQEERAYNEAIHRLIAARTRVSEQELVWANGEENLNFFTLYGKFAELQWIYNDAAKCMANKQLSVRKAFKNIFQEERILEESKKELQSCNSKLAKLQKQVENAKKKNDTSKVISLETELAAQITLSEQLIASVESQSQKLELYKIKELKRSLVTQAEGVLTLAGHCQQLYAAHMQLIDLMPDVPPSSCKGEKSSSDTSGCLEQRMSEVVTRVSDLLSIHPPVNGGIDPKKLAVSTPSAPPAPCPGSSSPHNFRRSLVDQIGLDIFRSKSKDELCPSATPPAVRPKRPSQKPLKHPVYKVDTGAADEIEPTGPGGRSSPAAALHHSPVSLSQITGITIEEASPSRSKPRVDYTQGMYCEIVIPDDGGVSPPLLFSKQQQLPPPEVPIRRTSSDTPPNEVKHSRNLSLDRNRQMFEQTLKHSQPLGSTTDSETASAQFSSSEDLEVVVGELDPGYARVNIRPLSGPSPIGASSQDSEESGGYANPVDALNLPSEVIQKRFSMGPASLPEDRTTGPTEEQKNSPYQSVEDVRKMRELQNHQRQQMKQNQSGQRSNSVSPNTSRTNLHGQQQQQEDNEQVNYYDDNPGYSRPFDALSGLPHTKTTTDKNAKVSFTPLPPAMRRTASGDRPGKERSAKSLHNIMTNVNNKESEKVGVDKMREGSCKKSWKVPEPSYRGNGSMTPPPVPPTDRPKPMEQWQLPTARQKQQEKSVDKSYLRSKSDQSFKNELQATLRRAGANISDHSEHPSRGESGRTSSEGAMYRMKTKQPLMNVHQLRAKKLNPTKAN